MLLECHYSAAGVYGSKEAVLRLLCNCFHDCNHLGVRCVASACQKLKVVEAISKSGWEVTAMMESMIIMDSGEPDRGREGGEGKGRALSRRGRETSK